jgi:flavonoid 3'-monooxygenase
VIMILPDILFQNSSSLRRHQRKIFLTELVGPKRLEATQHVRAEEMAHLIRTMPQNREVELRIYLCVLLNNIISRLILNRRLSARLGEHETEEQMLEIKKFKEITYDISYCLGAFYPGDFIPGLKWLDPLGLEKRFKDTNNRMDSFASKIITEHEAERKLGPIAEQDKDMVHILLDEVENTEEKHQITMTNVKGMMWVRRLNPISTQQ